MNALSCLSIAALAGALSLSPGVVRAQESVARCASMLQDAPALARMTSPAFKYPESAFAGGKEGTVGYQYRLLDDSGRVSVNCIYRSSGDAEIDLAVVRRVNVSVYYTLKGFDWSRDASRVYQDTQTLSWTAESRARTKSDENSLIGRLIYEPPLPPPYLLYKFEGAAMLRGRVNEAGAVDVVSMLRSSGDTHLDALAMASMLKYKFKPGEAFTFDRMFTFDYK
ncbi:MAG: TonB family protein [Rhizobacter sp.]